MLKKYIILSLIILLSNTLFAGEGITDGLHINVEMQGSVSDGATPLWLTSNKYGLSSTEEINGYTRVSAIKNIDSIARKWNWGYGVDVAIAANYTSTFIVQQAYAELQWKKMNLSIGAKENKVEFKDAELSSGALSFGCNSRPIPTVRIYMDWFSFPGTKQWWKWKVLGSFGMTTDGRWLKSVVPSNEHYTGNVLYHEKALYWKFGKETHTTFPVTYEFGIQMAAQFGGTTYNIAGRDHNTLGDIKHSQNLMAFVHALTATGTDETDGSSKNTEGNHMGSWNMRLTWHGKDWKIAGRFERFFEDQSMMFIQYGIYDHLLGIDASLPQNKWLSKATVEHLSTYNQSGAILHDAAINIPEKMNGRDNYYNHNLYVGYQHWGQAIGNPLLISPIYNEDGSLLFKNNRVKAWHIGLAGDPVDWIHWRAKATFAKYWGTYDNPLEDPTCQKYFLVEVSANPKNWKGWQLQLGLAKDFGHVIGNNTGAQLTIRKEIR